MPGIAPACPAGIATACPVGIVPASPAGVAPVRARGSDARKGVSVGRRFVAPLLLVLAALIGCHAPQGVRGYVLDAEGGHARVYTRDVDYEDDSALPEAHPVSGALVRVEVLGQAGGWVPFGPFAKRAETRTDGLGSFLMEWSEMPHPQDARLLVQKEGFEPLEYRFALPGYQEVKVFLVRVPHGGGAR